MEKEVSSIVEVVLHQKAFLNRAGAIQYYQLRIYSPSEGTIVEGLQTDTSSDFLIIFSNSDFLNSEISW